MLLALVVPTASASILSGYLNCGGVGSPTGSNVFNGGAIVPTATLSGGLATITCGAITVPTGDTLTQVDLEFYGDAHAPIAAGASIVETWNSLAGVSFGTGVITISAPGPTSFNQCGGTGGTFTGLSCDVVLSFTENVAAGSGFGPVTAQVSAAAGAGGGVAGNGGDSANLFIQYEYASGVPEPATLSLMGGALLGLGVFARKLARR